MSAQLFLEIGTEELPAGFVPRALQDLERLLTEELRQARIEFGAVQTFATPRRLAIAIADVARLQQRQELEITGPPARIAYDQDGQPTKAAEGFARTNGVAVADLTTVETAKGTYLQIAKVIEGGESRAQLEKILPRVIARIPFKKSMRWKDLEVRFARPMHWLVALYAGQIVPFSFGDLNSGDCSRGHRFMAPEAFAVADLDDYLVKLEQHQVVPDVAKRRQLIAAQIEQLAAQVGGQVNQDEELLDEVTFLVESPQALLGRIEDEFLQLPAELLITSMREHQRYFTLLDEQGALLPYFITIANTHATDSQVVVAGNERVLKARLADAMFFWKEDQKKSLESRLEPLKKVVYQAKLGTSFEKIERFTQLAVTLAQQFAPATVALTRRAATLAKCDLETGMVYEFPELQGVMGREYALLEGEDERVARAIYEHYLPLQAGGALPTDDVGAFVSLADKIDTICGCFSVGLIPTGTADPYALRRNAIGLLAIIRDRGYALSVPGLVRQAVALLEPKRQREGETICADVVEFIRLRFANALVGQGQLQDVVDAVLSASFDQPLDALARIEALTDLKQRADFEPLAVAFKRVGNIIKEGTHCAVAPELLTVPCEKDLYAAVCRVEEQLAAQVAQGRYDQVLTTIAGLRAPIDNFFAGVMVMDEDEAVKSNRLALLTQIAGLYQGIADFSRIA